MTDNRSMNSSMNRHPLPVILGTMVFVVTIVSADHLPWWLTISVALGAGLVIGWHMDRRWWPAFIAVVVFTTMFTVLFNERADAGPTPHQPATDRIARSEAHEVAEYAVKKWLYMPLPAPRKFKVGHCYSGPRVWRCPATASGGDADCTTTVVVWADEENYYFEFYRLRCS